MSAVAGALAFAWLGGAVACAWAAFDLRRNGSGTGGASLVMIALVCLLWPVLMATPLRWIERLGGRRLRDWGNAP